MSAFANFWGTCQRRFDVRITAPWAPSHQLEAFESEHGLFNHVILRFSFRNFFLRVGNPIWFFFRATNYYGRSSQSQARRKKKKEERTKLCIHTPGFPLFLGFGPLAHVRAIARCLSPLLEHPHQSVREVYAGAKERE